VFAQIVFSVPINAQISDMTVLNLKYMQVEQKGKTPYNSYSLVVTHSNF